MGYPGGKGASGVVQTIINQQPPHDVYVEPFLGGGAVLLAKRPARSSVGIDIDPGAIAAFSDSTRSVDHRPSLNPAERCAAAESAVMQ